MLPAGGGYGGGLARFQSVPATWLEALLRSDEDIITNPPITSTDFVVPSPILPSPDIRFVSQNSSPLEFVSDVNNSYDYFSNLEIPASYDDYLSSSPHIKQFRDIGLEDSPAKFTTQTKYQSGDRSALLNVEMEEKMVHPSRVRAKRGFATHPRSIAERVRRSRISDRIRKLQEVVPNMDKQTNTADMLDEAVEYVKFLQTQIQDLTQHQNKCTCYG